MMLASPNRNATQLIEKKTMSMFFVISYLGQDNLIWRLSLDNKVNI